ncbi:hypothetical protein GCM10027048_20250 [Hymenobacter coalescens]
MPLNAYEMARAALLDLIAQYLPDNDTEQITPAALRTVLVSLVHSMFVKLSDLVLGPNLRPDLRKAVRWYSEATQDYDGDGPVLLDLDPDLMCLSTTISCDFGPDGTGKEYAFVFDENGPWNIWRDATFTGPRVNARLVLLGSQEQRFAGIEPWNPYATYAGPNPDGNFASQVSHKDKLWTARVPMAPGNFPPGQAPEPGTVGGAAFWKELSPTPVVHQQNTDTGTISAEFAIGHGTESQGSTEYRLLKFVSDAQRANVAVAVRWTPQAGGGDLVELVKCLEFIPPVDRPGNVWEPIGSGDGGGLPYFYLEDETQLALENEAGERQTISLDALVPTILPGSRVLVVQGAGQDAGTARRDRAGKPYVSVTAAHGAAQDGDTVLVLPGGTSLLNGRPAYAEPLYFIKNLFVQGLGLPQMANAWDLGRGGLATDIVVKGMYLNSAYHLFPNLTQASRIRFEDCVFGPQAYLVKYRSTNQFDAVATIELVRCRGVFEGAGPAGFLRYDEHDSLASPSILILDDCRFATTATSFITGQMRNPAVTGALRSRVVLRGTTRIELPDGVPLDAVTIAAVGTPLASSEWLTDERAPVGGGGPAPDLTNYYTKAESDARYSSGTDLVAQFLAAGAQTGTFLVQADEAGVYSLYSSTGVSAVSYKKNGVATALPVALAAGDTLEVLATGAGTVRLRKP